MSTLVFHAGPSVSPPTFTPALLARALSASGDHAHLLEHAISSASSAPDAVRLLGETVTLLGRDLSAAAAPLRDIQMTAFMHLEADAADPAMVDGWTSILDQIARLRDLTATTLSSTTLARIDTEQRQIRLALELTSSSPLFTGGARLPVSRNTWSGLASIAVAAAAFRRDAPLRATPAALYVAALEEVEAEHGAEWTGAAIKSDKGARYVLQAGGKIQQQEAADEQRRARLSGLIPQSTLIPPPAQSRSSIPQPTSALRPNVAPEAGAGGAGGAAVAGGSIRERKVTQAADSPRKNGRPRRILSLVQPDESPPSPATASSGLRKRAGAVSPNDPPLSAKRARTTGTRKPAGSRDQTTRTGGADEGEDEDRATLSRILGDGPDAHLLGALANLNIVHIDFERLEKALPLLSGLGIFAGADFDSPAEAGDPLAPSLRAFARALSPSGPDAAAPRRSSRRTDLSVESLTEKLRGFGL